jgi:pimeloyl-ACP methyl ester carboxylesterase
MQKKRLKLLLYILVILSLLCYGSVAVAHAAVFSRADYDEYAANRFLLYDDLDAVAYPREEIDVLSGGNRLTGYLYGAENSQGLIIVSPGHRDPNDVKLYEITYFVDAGWTVLCYDYTGCYQSEGSSMVGYSQSVHDLDAVLTYVETETRFEGLPVMLFGHSMGAYASAAVLQLGHDVDAVISASGFDTPKEQWEYCIERYTNIFHIPLLPFTKLFIAAKYGGDADLSAIEGINSVDVPVLVISGTEDEYYGGESPIYAKRDQISNPNCSFMLMEASGANGHYDYFLTKEAISYREMVDGGAVQGTIDKGLYMEHDKDFMNTLHSFFLSALE